MARRKVHVLICQQGTSRRSLQEIPLSGPTATAAHLIDGVDLEEGVGQLWLAGGGVDGALAGVQAREDQRLVEVHALIVQRTATWRTLWISEFPAFL